MRREYNETKTPGIVKRVFNYNQASEVTLYTDVMSLKKYLSQYPTTIIDAGEYIIATMSRRQGDDKDYQNNISVLDRITEIDLSKFFLNVYIEKTKKIVTIIFESVDTAKATEEAISNIDWLDAYEELVEERGY